LDALFNGGARFTRNGVWVSDIDRLTRATVSAACTDRAGAREPKNLRELRAAWNLIKGDSLMDVVPSIIESIS
jgi:hypothetical protein